MKGLRTALPKNGMRYCGRLSNREFDLAVQLLPMDADEIRDSIVAKARKVLVDGMPINALPCDGVRVMDLCRDLWSQFFVRVG